MSEEMTATIETPETGNESTSNGDALNDFFSTHELVDDYGEPVDGKTQETLEGKKQTPESKSKTAKDDGNNEAASKDPEFLGRFVNDKGELSVKDILGFLSPKEGEAKTPKVSIDPPIFKQQEPKKEGTEPEISPRLKKLQERKKFLETARTERLMWPNAYQEGVAKGLKPTDAVEYANAKIREDEEERAAKWEDEWETKSLESEKKKVSPEVEEAHKVRALANYKTYADQLGSKEDADAFFFGTQSADGKTFKPGFATDFIHYQFARDFAAQAGEGEKPTQEDYVKWWVKFASDQKNVHLAFEYGKAKMILATLPHWVKEIQKNGDTSNKFRKTVATKVPGKPKQQEPMAQADLDIQNMFTPPSRRKTIDEV